MIVENFTCNKVKKYVNEGIRQVKKQILELYPDDHDWEICMAVYQAELKIFYDLKKLCSGEPV